MTGECDKCGEHAVDCTCSQSKPDSTSWFCLSEKLRRNVRRYREEKKLLDAEMVLLKARYEFCFDTFLSRCSDSYEESMIGYFFNPLKEYSGEKCEFDPITLGKYIPD